MNKAGSQRHGTAIQRHVDDAVRFLPRPARGVDARPIRVATRLVTCAAAAEMLNELGVAAEGDCVYRFVNVHNPRCPLFHDPVHRRWCCARELEDHPVWGINWAGALLICKGLGARLPLAREWECFASNNDPSRIYPWGDAAPTPLLANFGEFFGGTTAVGSFPPSELGLYDLAGNLGEWCHDACNRAGSAGAAMEKVVKGGAWSKDARYLEIAASRGKWGRLGTTTIGFRPVWDD